MELAKLPNELLINIFTLLHNEAAANLLPVALVSRRFYEIIVPLLYQNVQIDISRHPKSDSLADSREPTKQPLRTLFTRLSTSRSVRALIRNIHVRAPGKLQVDAIDRLQSWIPEFSQLSSFCWDEDSCARYPSHVDNDISAQIPIKWDGDFNMRDGLLYVLGRHWPKAHLHLRMEMAGQSREIPWKVLKQAPDMLRSLKVRMSYGRLRSEARERLFWALRNTPGLQSLTTYDHDIHSNRSCRHRPPQAQPPGYQVKLESPLPQLVELSIADGTLTADDLLEWGTQKGWTRLEKITLRDARLLRAFHGCERSLRSIRLIDAREGYEDALVEICSRTIRLTDLKIKAAESRPPLSALGVCGHSLVTLAIHPHHYDTYDWEEMEDISLWSLERVQRLCPRLTNLSSSLCCPLDNLAYLAPLGRISSLTHITLRFLGCLQHGPYDPAVEVVEKAFRYLVENGVPEQNLESLTLQDGAQISDWDNPWAAANGPGRVFRATKKTDRGNHEPEITAKQIRGPPEIDAKIDFSIDHCSADDYVEPHLLCCSTTFPGSAKQGEAERQTRAHLDTMPPAILRDMIEANSGQINGTSSAAQDFTYESRTGGSSRKEAEYEETWRQSSGILPILEWQLRKRKEQGWNVWDMPLMQVEAGEEGFLYDAMTEAEAESECEDVDLTICKRQKLKIQGWMAWFFGGSPGAGSIAYAIGGWLRRDVERVEQDLADLEWRLRKWKEQWRNL